jgi:hypothetical protein
MCRPVEGHVLDEVRHAALVFVLEHGTGFHREPQFRTRTRLAILANVIAKTVGQRADGDERINRDGLIERGGANRWWDGRRRSLLSAREPQRSNDRCDKDHEPDTCVVSHVESSAQVKVLVSAE